MQSARITDDAVRSGLCYRWNASLAQSAVRTCWKKLLRMRCILSGNVIVTAHLPFVNA